MRQISCAVINFGNNRIGLQLRDVQKEIEHPGKVSFFGGNIEAGETPHQGLHREIEEELGLLPNDYLDEFIGEYLIVDGFGNQAKIYLYLISEVKFDQLGIYEGHLCITNISQDLKYLDVAPELITGLKDIIQKIRLKK